MRSELLASAARAKAKPASTKSLRESIFRELNVGPLKRKQLERESENNLRQMRGEPMKQIEADEAQREHHLRAGRRWRSRTHQRLRS